MIDKIDMASDDSSANYPVVILPAADKQPIGAEQNLFPKHIMTCEKESKVKKYKDIAYFIEGDAFYLMDETAVQYLEDAESKFKARFKGKDRTNVMPSLSQAGILDGLLSATLTSFIADEDKLLFQETEHWLSHQQKHLQNASSAYEASALVNQKREIHKRILAKAQQNAKEQGYIFDDGKLYSPKEPKIRKAIKAYQKAREAFLKQSELTPQAQIDDLKKRLQALNKVYSNAQYQVGDAVEYYKAHLIKQTANAEKHKEALEKSIEDLSVCGIATPELALAGQDKSKGHEYYALYFDYLKRAKKQEDALNEKLKALLKSTNNFALPPNQILKEEYKQLKSLEKEALKIHLQAITNILNMSSSLFLLWDIEDYRPKPLKYIVKGDFPLREYILGGSNGNQKDGLRYCSLIDIPQPEAKGNKLISAEEKSDYAIIEMLGDYLQELPIEDGWFGEDGVFDSKAFYKTLSDKHIEVESLKKNSKVWEQAISKVLFSRDLKARLSPFDDSKQAQALRMTVASIQSGLSNPLEIGVVNESHASGSTNKMEMLPLEAKTELILAKGEVNIFKMLTGKPLIKIPEAITKQDRDPVIPVKYEHNGVPKLTKFQCGAIQAQFYCKAWGFAGANLILGGKVELNAGGLSIPKLYEVNDDEVSFKGVKFEMGLKAGVEIGGFIFWYPPSGYPEYLIDKDSSAHSLMKGVFKIEKSKMVELPFRFRFVDKRLLIGVRFGPPSVGLAFEGAINPTMIGAWIWQFQRLLRQAHYRRIDIVADDETFKQLSLLSKGILYSQLNIGLFLAKQKDTYDNILDIFEQSSAGLVAYTLINGDEKILSEWMRLMIPEALGPLLFTLVSSPKGFNVKDGTSGDLKIEKDEALLIQQLALCKVIHWLGNDHIMSVEQQAATRQMQKALERMNPYSKASQSEDVKKNDFLVNRRTILKFMEKDFNVDMDKPYNIDYSMELYKYSNNRMFYTEFDALTVKLFDAYYTDRDVYANAAFDEGLSHVNNGRH